MLHWFKWHGIHFMGLHHNLLLNTKGKPMKYEGWDTSANICDKYYSIWSCSLSSNILNRFLLNFREELSLFTDHWNPPPTDGNIYVITAQRCRSGSKCLVHWINRVLSEQFFMYCSAAIIVTPFLLRLTYPKKDFRYLFVLHSQGGLGISKMN